MRYMDNELKRHFRRIIKLGEPRIDDLGVDTMALFGDYMTFDLRDGFPITSLTEIPFFQVVDELLWFISGSDNVNDMPVRSQHLWNRVAEEDGYIGPCHGVQLRKSVRYTKQGEKDILDQLLYLEETLSMCPNSRRQILDYWNVSDLLDQAHIPTITNAQYSVSANHEHLSAIVNLRSVNSAKWLSHTIAVQALLLHMLAEVNGYEPLELHISIGNAYIKQADMPAIKEMLRRRPRLMPLLEIKPNIESVVDYIPSDFELIDYNPHSNLQFVSSPIL